MGHEPVTDGVGVTAVITAFSLTACHHRTNEDSVILGPLAPASDLARPLQVLLPLSAGASFLVAVADGMGGHPSGDVASRMVTGRLVRRIAGVSSPAALAEAINEVNHALYAVMASRPELAGMGSTVVGAVFHDDAMEWFNVGDSPAFVWDPPYLAQLSCDDVATGPADGRITQSLGGMASFAAIEPHVGSEKVQFPARYLVCSDGLTKVVTVPELEMVMDQPALPLAQALAERVIARGTPDDCSVVIVDLVQLEHPAQHGGLS